MDYSTWLTKQEAAERIGVSTKSVEKLARDGQLQQASWRRDGRGAILAVYHPDDVARIARERQPGLPAFVLPPAQAASPANGSNGAGGALAVQSPVGPGDDVLRAIFAAALRAVTSETSQKSSKLFLTIEEAAAVTGLPRAYLRRLVKDGKLEATRTRPRLVRRRDLEGL